MLPSSFVVSCAVALAVVACTSNTPINGQLVTNQAGAAGGVGSVGSAGAAGTSTGAAGTGTTGAAGFIVGQAGSGTPGTGGSAGTGAGGAAGTAGTGAAGQAGVTGQGGVGAVGGSTGTAMCGSPTTASGACAQGAYPRAGVCACQDGEPCVCNGACTDPLTDDDNCGACGHQCGPTSTCNAGVCGPPVVNVIPSWPGCKSIDITVSDGNLIWSDEGHGLVQSMPIGGTAISTIATAEAGPTRVTAVGGAVFWIDRATRTIRRGGGGAVPATIVTSPVDINGLVVSPNAALVYFSSGTNVSQVSAAGYPPVVVAREERGGIPHALALSGNLIAFPTELNGDVDVATIVDGQVASCGGEDANGNVAQVNCPRLARSQGELLLDAIFTTSGQVVWADGSNVKTEAPTSTIMTFESLAQTTSSNAITGLATSATAVYFADADPSVPTGVVSRALLTSTDGLGARLARGQNAPRALAVGPTKIYWSTGDCSIESQSP
jgi:hypothetical protein